MLTISFRLRFNSFALALTLPAALLMTACSTTPGGQLSNNTKPIVVESAIPATIAVSLKDMGRTVKPMETEALYAPLAQKEPYANVKVERDQRYGSNERHLLDVFSPTLGSSITSNRPVLVFVHGGAFTRGNKRTGTSPFYDNIMLWAAKNGMVGVNMTYRLAPQHTWPAVQEDIAAAVTWIQQNIAARGGNPKRIFLMGHSAGAAHVAQYVGHSANSGLSGALIISGLFDPQTAEANAPLQSYFGIDKTHYARRNALPGMSKARLPTFLTYAELDPPDFHLQSQQAHKTLCDAGQCSQLVVLKGHSHMSEIHSINTADSALTMHMLRFINYAPR